MDKKQAAEVTMYLISKSRIVRLYKILKFETLPRMGEFLKIRNKKLGDYFSFSITQIIQREDDIPEIWIQMTSLVNRKSLISFWPEEELDEYMSSYQEEGWELLSDAENKIFKEDSELASFQYFRPT